MNNLSNTIYHYYVNHFNELPLDNQIHFASRLSQWTGDPKAKELLNQCNAASLPESDAAARQKLTSLLAASISLKQDLNMPGKRLPYFERYPELYGLELALFQARNWYYFSKFDARPALLELKPQAAIEKLLRAVQSDTESLKYLSSYAVNVLYLYQRFLLEDEAPVFNEATVKQLSYNAADSDELTLLVYFVTHCVIGESIFYARPIPKDKLAASQEMLAYLASLLRQNTSHLTLDALLEFVVAARLCGFENPLCEQILQLAAGYFDAHKGFLVDPKKPDKNSLAGAEHRNTLFIMASTPSRLAP